MKKAEKEYQRMKEAYQKPTHAWIARAECGCVLAVATVSPDLKRDGKLVGEMVESGLIPERVTWERYQEIAKEPTFLSCPHDEKTPQMKLFEV